MVFVCGLCGEAWGCDYDGINLCASCPDAERCPMVDVGAIEFLTCPECVDLGGPDGVRVS